jgi:hypothetical protein
LNTTVVVRDCPLFVPFTTTLKVPAALKLHDKVAVWLGGRVTLSGVEQAVVPVPPVTFVDKATTPPNPVEPPTLIVEVSVAPVPPFTVDGLAERAKLVTANENCGLAA